MSRRRVRLRAVVSTIVGRDPSAIPELVGDRAYRDLENAEPSAWAQNPAHLAEDRAAIVDVMHARDPDQSVDARVFERKLVQRRAVPLDAPVLPRSGEHLRRIDGDQAYVEGRRKMVGEIAAARR